MLRHKRKTEVIFFFFKKKKKRVFSEPRNRSLYQQ
jgi:hypothetical protein